MADFDRFRVYSITERGSGSIGASLAGSLTVLVSSLRTLYVIVECRSGQIVAATRQIVAGTVGVGVDFCAGVVGQVVHIFFWRSRRLVWLAASILRWPICRCHRGFGPLKGSSRF